MSGVQAQYGVRDRVSAVVISLVLLLVLLLAGLLLADESLRQNADERARIDATTSAEIVAQEVKLTGERLYELGSRYRRQGLILENGPMNHNATQAEETNGSLQAVWLLDTLGDRILDSAHEKDSPSRDISLVDIDSLAQRIAENRYLQLRRVSRSPGTYHESLVLLGEPIFEGGTLTGIAVALVNEGQLLAPAGTAAVEGRSFLALLIDGDTVARTARGGSSSRRNARVRVPLPGRPEWFVVSAQSPRENTMRIGIWSIGALAFALLLFGLARERRQMMRIAERSVELERLSAELLRANRMKSEFLANVSHELRTPLNAIVGFVDLLRDGGYGELSERQRTPVERVATSTARLRKLVDEVLDIAKIAAGRLDIHAEVIAIRPFLLNVVNEIEPLLTGKHLSIQIDTAPEIAKVITDPTHLRQILINLLGNAVKYTERGQITVRTRVEQFGPPPRSVAATGQHAALRLDQPHNWIAVDVVDSGIGIAANDFDRIFEEFEQIRVVATQNRAEHGTGLGLAISRRLAILLGGDVSVESTLGQGSTFSIWLPLGDEMPRYSGINGQRSATGPD